MLSKVIENIVRMKFTFNVNCCAFIYKIIENNEQILPYFLLGSNQKYYTW